MMGSYGDLFQELYNHKYIEQKPYQNAIQRIKQMQKKMKEERGQRKYHEGCKSVGEYLPNLQHIDVIHDDTPKRIIRTLLPKKKKRHSKIDQLSHEQINAGSENCHENVGNHVFLRTNRNIPYTHRARQNIPTPMDNYQNKNIYQSLFKVRTESRKRTQRKSDSIHSQKRSMSPSKKVIIGGRNLQKQAESYRQEFIKLDEELERYQRTINDRNFESRRKSIRSQKQSRQQKIRDGVRQNKKFRISKKFQKEENVQLQPWSVMAQHQFY